MNSFWDDSYAEGDEHIYFQKFSPPLSTSWQILCLAGGAEISGVDGVQVISFVINNEDGTSGFTISYQAYPIPRIFRFDSHATDSDTILRNGLFWRTPSKFTRDVSTPNSQDVSQTTSVFGHHRQKNLSFHSLGDLIESELEAMKNAANKALLSCRHQFPAVHSFFNKLSHKISTFLCPRRHRDSHALQNFVMGSSQSSTGANSIAELSQAPHDKASTGQAEDFDIVEVLPPSASSSAPYDSSNLPGLTKNLTTTNPTVDGSNQRAHQVKTLALAVVLIAILIWTYKWARDPRRRADRAARREERRRRHLYRRAARIQKLRNWFGSFQRQFCSLRDTVREWDEKQLLVLHQEEILETVMKDAIRTLRHAYLAENNIVAAEEGRNHYIDEVDSRSERRRSMTTLPGYESEGTQPPGYESDAVSMSSRFRYTTIDSEDTPDSSVVSTSPRISRDGRDSDFEKEVPSEWTLESGPLHEFRSVDV